MKERLESGKPNINIPETPCNPGFKGGNPLYRVIAEDLSASEAGDFDFNDVVFDVVKAENGKTTLKLICAGGVLKAETGVAACKILVDDRFPVVPERQSIGNKNGNFTTYVPQPFIY